MPFLWRFVPVSRRALDSTSETTTDLNERIIQQRMDKSNKLVVIAIGGNSLIRDSKHTAWEDQYQAAHETCIHIAAMLERGA